MQDELTIITNTGERFSIDTSTITDAKPLAGTDLYTAYAWATTCCTECEVALFANDTACTDLVAIGLYDPSGYDVQWILSQDPRTLVYTVAVIDSKNEVVDCQVDIDLVEEPTLPRILRDEPEIHYMEYPIGTIFSYSCYNHDKHYEIVRIERLGVASLEEAELISQKNLSDTEILTAIESKYPDMLEWVFSFMDAFFDRVNEKFIECATFGT